MNINVANDDTTTMSHHTVGTTEWITLTAGTDQVSLFIDKLTPLARKMLCATMLDVIVKIGAANQDADLDV